ncbi:hypothetical protein [Vibrio sp. SCSIO 43137]|uniref:hypothetical protein n=1 Tax=Vibrio sp. SCSIO 43137 TaxID=3021011 RepID=UPI002307341B|nr:hypothetical protein [Vibrio sp. SCSIO 43137]WCE31477.1 hypothetical protein PK654_20320 [Vibrio sp. SCSIO 43137]
MHEIIVSKLKQQLEVAGVDTLHLSDKEAQLFSVAVEKKADFFDTVCEKKSNQNPLLLLLGLLTKSHIEAISQLESQLDAIAAMHDVFVETVGDEQSGKLKADSVIELSLVTKLWLMVQGYLNMDFGLANDHAQKTADLLAKALHAESHEIRTELLAGYYHGKEKRKEDTPVTQWPEKILQWLHLSKNN